MAGGPTVGLRLNKLDKAALTELADRLQMNKTQTIRVLVRETLAILKEREAQDPSRASARPEINEPA